MANTNQMIPIIIFLFSVIMKHEKLLPGRCYSGAPARLGGGVGCGGGGGACAMVTKNENTMKEFHIVDC